MTPRGWRAFREFSNGQMGDLCVHFFDCIRYFLDLAWPRRISASGGILVRDRKSPSTVPDTQTAVFDSQDGQGAGLVRVNTDHAVGHAISR